MSTKNAVSAPSKWRVVMGTTNTFKFHVVRETATGREFRASAAGRMSTFKTRQAAERVMRRLNEDDATEAALKAKYAGLPPLPDARGAIGRAIRGA